MGEKIRILFLSANPGTTSRIRVDQEIREISEKLEEGGAGERFELAKYPALRPGDLPRLLMKYKPHIVHFSGHGFAQKIILEGGGGKGKQIDPKGLVDLFRLFKDHVRMVLLNACVTKAQARTLTEVIDYSVGISRAIGDRAAVTFAAGFYRALGFGKPVQEAFELAKAELKLTKTPRSKGIELFVRRGVNEDERFPPADADGIDDSRDTLKSALAHLFGGNSNEEETRCVRRAMLDGSLILEQTDEAIEGDARIFETSAVRGSGKALRAEVDYHTYRRTQEHLFPAPPGIAPPLPGLMVVGREGSLADLKTLLQSKSTKHEQVGPTVVRGWPGVGKTTLVGVLGRDPEILKAFPDGVLWTSLERKPELMTKLADWGRVLGTDDLLRTPTADEAVVKLAALLRHRRMLLIVDDIWDQAHAIPFIRAATGTSCALLATTRLTHVAEDLSPGGQRIYVLPVLSEADSLVLLRYLAPAVVEQYPEECRELVGDLGYLPLALQVAGRLLKAEARMGLSVVDLIEGIRTGAKFLEEPAPIDRAEGMVRPTVQALLKRSTDELDEATRNCFAYLGPFAPKPATFDSVAMSAVWEVADPAPTIRKLVSHGLLEPVGAGRFQMHELLVKHARSLLKGS